MASPIDLLINGKTQLMHSVAELDEGRVIELLRRGANPDVRDAEGKTALIHAAQSALADSEALTTIALCLLAGRADPSLTDGQGRTAEWYARAGGLAKLSELLVLMNRATNGVDDRDIAGGALGARPSHLRASSLARGRAHSTLPKRRHSNTFIAIPPSSTLDRQRKMCLLMQKKTEGKKPIGQGDHAKVYKFGPEDGLEDRILKVSEWQKAEISESELLEWKTESSTGKVMGELGVGPKIHDRFLCSGKGYIIMDLITPLTQEQPELVGSDDWGTVLHLNLFNPQLQERYAHVLEIMCENGYVHMDNHPKNLGFARGVGAGKPLVFDFGLTQKRVMTKRDKRWALALSLFIIIEHASRVSDIRRSFLYKAALAEMRGRPSLLVGAGEYAAPSCEAGVCGGELLPSAKELEAELAPEALSFKGPNQDVYDACLNYVRLLELPRRDRYNHPLYSRIYDMRNHWPMKSTEGVLAELLLLRPTPPPQSASRRRRHGD